MVCVEGLLTGNPIPARVLMICFWSLNRAYLIYEANSLNAQEEGKVMETYIDNQGNIVCSIHMDESVMNSHDECNECLDDAHEAEILSR